VLLIVLLSVKQLELEVGCSRLKMLWVAGWCPRTVGIVCTLYTLCWETKIVLISLILEIHGLSSHRGVAKQPALKSWT
jgi:hypothetical protein